MQTACKGYRYAGENKIKRELVSHWLKANQVVNRLPERSIELPNGIVVLSQDYLQVLDCLMQLLTMAGKMLTYLKYCNGAHYTNCSK